MEKFQVQPDEPTKPRYIGLVYFFTTAVDEDEAIERLSVAMNRINYGDDLAFADLSVSAGGPMWVPAMIPYIEPGNPESNTYDDDWAVSLVAYQLSAES